MRSSKEAKAIADWMLWTVLDCPRDWRKACKKVMRTAPRRIQKLVEAARQEGYLEGLKSQGAPITATFIANTDDPGLEVEWLRSTH